MPSTQLRQTIIAQAHSAVVKLGTNLLTDTAGSSNDLDAAYLADFARQIVALRQRGVEVTVVSSGAIRAGCAQLGLKKRPKDVAALQAVAAVGQRGLMTRFHEAFAPHGIKVAQLLLTRDDFDERSRFLNIRNCIHCLHAMGCLPVVNENDTVAVEEIKFGDNDQLSALLTNAVGAQVLVLLSVVDGLLDEKGKAIDLVTDAEGARGLARDEKSSFGTGGMTSKLDAARQVTEAGDVAVIANGRSPDILPKLFAGQRVGTVFAPKKRKMASRERWIGLTKRPAGAIRIDQGAVSAICQRGKSLLAKGITAVTGEFDRAAVVAVLDPQGTEVARGLCNFTAAQVRQIMGRASGEFPKIIGHPVDAEVIHRDNLVVISA
ncbi:MAG: glutamate 5-kinase [Phycisphaeraceae bacterium]|nr:glutamate 5-kinase [Phycisphaeraceae bacterium]